MTLSFSGTVCTTLLYISILKHADQSRSSTNLLRGPQHEEIMYKIQNFHGFIQDTKVY